MSLFYPDVEKSAIVCLGRGRYAPAPRSWCARCDRRRIVASRARIGTFRLEAVAMTSTSDAPQFESDQRDYSPGEVVHTLLRLVLAVRYHKNLVAAVMAAAALLGGLYYATATRLYSAKSALLITRSGNDRLDTSITNDDLQRQNFMPTFESMVTSARVLEGRWPALRRAIASRCPVRRG